MIELVEGFWVFPDDIKAIKRISKKSCSVWVTGQSATDGFVLNCPAEDVLEALGYSVSDEDDEGEDDDDE